MFSIFKRFRVRPVRRRRSQAEYKKYKEHTRALVMSRLEYFNQFYNFKFNTVRIKNQKTRWGSCSTNGNLNFNYTLGLISPEQADYVIVHELCHLGEFNHGANFWKLVERTIPEYRNIRASMKKIRIVF